MSERDDLDWLRDYYLKAHSRLEAALIEIKQLRARCEEAEQQLQSTCAALEAITMLSANGKQWCFQTHNGIPMGMSRKQERLVRIALAARGKEKA